MIYIDINKRSPNKKWLAKSDKLTRKLIELYNKGDKAGIDDLIEKNSKHWGELKKWLLSLSYNKCWFSESRDIYSHMDVEHFRPKKEAKDIDGNDRGGYWWLAFDYKNFRACGNVGNRMKGGWFPLKNGSLISTFDAPCEESETPYLLDPIEPDDVCLLAFDEKGDAINNPNNSSWERERVDETIKRLKLNKHVALVDARKKVWQDVLKEINLYLEAKKRCASGANPVAKEKLRNHLLKIRAMTRETAELSSVAKWCLYFKGDKQLLKIVS